MQRSLAALALVSTFGVATPCAAGRVPEASPPVTSAIAPLSPPGARMTIVSGNGQRVPRVGTVVPGGWADIAPLSVEVVDASGAPIPHVPVTFDCETRAPQICQGSYDGAALVAVTGANGIATLSRLGVDSALVFGADGSFSVEATFGSLHATFTETVAADGPPAPVVYTAEILSGARQKAAIMPNGGATFGPVAVRLSGPDGKRAGAGILIRFSCQDSSCRFDGAPSSGFQALGIVTTDDSGIATLPGMTISGQSAGTFTVAVTGDTLIATSFTLRTRPPKRQKLAPASRPSALTIVSGDHQAIERGFTPSVRFSPGDGPEFVPLVVRLTDAAGRPIAGARVSFPQVPGLVSAPADFPGLPSVSDDKGADGQTDINGVATFSYRIAESNAAPAGARAFAITASCGPAHVTFHLQLFLVEPDAYVL